MFVTAYSLPEEGYAATQILRTSASQHRCFKHFSAAWHLFSCLFDTRERMVLSMPAQIVACILWLGVVGLCGGITHAESDLVSI